MRAALAAGDVEAARIAHETIGRLLGAPGADAGGIIASRPSAAGAAGSPGWPALAAGGVEAARIAHETIHRRLAVA
ncbi:hypothetical protein [Sorangium sp. So ce1153]|uniref:hypothetical protein n=1 Tax=Sorangium sp. So ce1153 TaxID=3133333 RepID=UPI003F5DD575